MKLTVKLLIMTLLLLPALSEARCRTVGESASIGTEYGTFPLNPAKRILEAGEKRDSVMLQWVGYGVGLPLFVVAMPFAMVGAGIGTALHPWTKCDQPENDWPGLK
jgi:hypothetical protein